MKSILKKTLSGLGYKIIKNNFTSINPEDWYFLKEKNSPLNLYLESIKKANNEHTDNLLKRLRFLSLIQIAEYIMKADIKGDIAECGVWKGHSAYILASLFGEDYEGEFHIFDSFEGGLSERGTEDFVEGLSTEQIMKEKEMFSSRKNEVQECLNQFDYVTLYEGWIPDRFNEVEDRKFSLVHVDVDLYQPTLDSLNFFWPRLNKGGAIVCDDYGSSQFPGAKKAMDEFLAQTSYKFFYTVPLGGCFIIKDF